MLSEAWTGGHLSPGKATSLLWRRGRGEIELGESRQRGPVRQVEEELLAVEVTHG